MIVGLILALVLGIVVGGGGGLALARMLSSARTTAQLAAERERHAGELGAARVEAASLQTLLEHERSAAEERKSATDDVRRQLVGEFAELFAPGARAEQHAVPGARRRATGPGRAGGAGDLDQRTQAIEQLLTPLREQLGRYEDGLRLLELERQKAYTGLSEQVRTLTQSQDKLQSETRNLVTALRSPATRGRWGRCSCGEWSRWRGWSSTATSSSR